MSKQRGVDISGVGLIAGIVLGLVLLPWLSIFHIHGDKAIGLWMMAFACIGGLLGTYVGRRISADAFNGQRKG